MGKFLRVMAYTLGVWFYQCSEFADRGCRTTVRTSRSEKFEQSISRERELGCG